MWFCWGKGETPSVDVSKQGSGINVGKILGTDLILFNVVCLITFMAFLTTVMVFLETLERWKTFGWYLWWCLLLVVPAPLLPVPPLLLRQSWRHADHTGDRLSWAKMGNDEGIYQHWIGIFLGTSMSISISITLKRYLFCGLLTRW